MGKIETYFELEAGSIATKMETGDMKFLVVYRDTLEDHTFPKGHVEEKETLEETAKRETLEETGYPVKINDFLGSFEYKVREEKYGKSVYIIRKVYYYHSEVIGENTGEENPDKKEGETISIWLSYEDALNKLTYDTDKNLIKEILKRHNEKTESDVYAKNTQKRGQEPLFAIERLPD